MGPVDAPTLLDKPRMHDVQYVHAKREAFEKLLSNNSKASNKGLGASMQGSQSDISTLTDHGQIAKMSLPPGWEEGPATSGGIGTRSFREVHPEADADAKLCFYYRGLPASDEAGKNFKQILDKQPHILTKNEIVSITEILRGKDDPKTFTPVMIRTEDINGKRVLTVNGRLNEKQADLKSILIDAEGTGTVVQEIYFQAPKELYLRYMKAARDAMNSIQWK
jgi:hypothetical protein